MIRSVSSSAPQETYAEAAWYLQKEIGLTHNEIFGGKQVVRRESGILEEVHIPSMNAKTFMAYLDLMERDVQKKKRAEKKQKMQQKMRGTGM